FSRDWSSDVCSSDLAKFSNSSPIINQNQSSCLSNHFLLYGYRLQALSCRLVLVTYIVQITKELLEQGPPHFQISISLSLNTLRLSAPAKFPNSSPIINQNQSSCLSNHFLLYGYKLQALSCRLVLVTYIVQITKESPE